ncbi:MAG: SGNH/GDSL hydrolase family protein, partial [Candidatus Aminicenantes bacterium]|nr:SGNH/GDSL hydrolase family protein [Candidatus Aminicenantes bacterium]
ANLSAGMRGENILLGVRCAGENFYVFWLNYHQKRLRLAYYDQHSSRLLPMSGFSFIGFPEIIEQDGELSTLLFLANRDGNDDIFCYELTSQALSQLTVTPFSEKAFRLRKTDAGFEIETSSLRARNLYRFNPHRPQLEPLAQREKLSLPATEAEDILTPEYYNTYIGFGDSITWGQIEAVQRLDLCYLTQMRDVFLATDYGPSGFVNLGIPGYDTLEGALGVDNALKGQSALYFLLMLGVNDVWRNKFSLASSLENLEYIVDAALARNMRVIVSTLTPRKDLFSSYQYYWNNLHALSKGILEIAARKGTSSIDTLSAFMNTNPPDGWKNLLETQGIVIIEDEEVEVKGNHPNVAGHSLIASLFAAALTKFPPLAPQNITVMNHQDRQQRTAFWDANYESDFSHFHIEFGFQPQDMRYSLDTATSYRTFSLFPFLPQFYFRIQTVDRGNQQSAFSTLETTAASSATQPNRKK